jgi:flagellar biosynthesis protein FlhF
MDIYEHFSVLEIESVILTKFDETKKVGELFSFLIEKQMPVSYISNGQHVPDDLKVASKEKLMDRFVSEFNE